MLSTTSWAMGCEDRMNDSLQQVHSRPCSQSTGMRGFFSSASTTLPTAVASSPMTAAIMEQNLRNDLRSTPCSRKSSYVVGLANAFSMATSLA